MTVQLAGGRIGGLPVKGGVISLDSADTSAVINATAGLVREAKNSVLEVGGAALSVGVASLPLLFACALLGGSRRELKYEAAPPPPDLRKPYKKVEDAIKKICRFGIDEEGSGYSFLNKEIYYMYFPKGRFTTRRELDWIRENIKLLPMNGLCVLTTDKGRFQGIFLDKQLRFMLKGQEQSTAIENVVALAKGDDDKHLGIMLCDHSIFEQITFEKLSFATLAGEVTVSSEEIRRIRGITKEEAEDIRSELVVTLKSAPDNLIDQIGLGLIERFFHLAPIKHAPKALPPPRKIASVDITIIDLQKCEVHGLFQQYVGTDRSLDSFEGFTAKIEVRDGEVKVLLDGAMGVMIHAGEKSNPNRVPLDGIKRRGFLWTGENGSGAARIADRYLFTFNWRES